MTNRNQQLRFGFFITNEKPTSRYPETAKKLNRVYRSIKNTDTILEKTITPTVEKIGFFDKTQFKHLSVCFTLVPSTEPAREITFRVTRIEPEYPLAKMSFHEEELLDGLQNDFVGFVSNHVATILRHICDKYNLDTSPIDRLCTKEKITEETADFSSFRFLEENKDELQIHVKLSDRVFGNPKEFVSNARVIDDLEAILDKTKSGEIDGHEMGMGYLTIFCMGENGRTMYEHLLPRLKLLPADSYVEILSNGKKDRLYPVE